MFALFGVTSAPWTETGPSKRRRQDVCLRAFAFAGRSKWIDASEAPTNQQIRVTPRRALFKGMFRKINNVFRPTHQQRGRDGGCGFEQDYHNACTIRLVRSTSMLVVGEKTQAAAGSTLKRSKSTVSIESTLYYYQRQEDRIWLYSQDQNCLEYLEALVALRRQYTKSVGDLKRKDTKTTVSSKKKTAPPAPKKQLVSLNSFSITISTGNTPLFTLLHDRHPKWHRQRLRPPARRRPYSSWMRSLPAATVSPNRTWMMDMLTWTS